MVPGRRDTRIEIHEPGEAKAGESPDQLNWLLFSHEDGNGTGFVSKLVKRMKDRYPRDRILVVQRGAAFVPADDGAGYLINPGQANDYQALIAQLEKQGSPPHRVVHLWNVNRQNKPGGESGLEWDTACEEEGFYSLLYLAQALGSIANDREITIFVVTDNMQQVSGDEVLFPQKATLMGPAMIIPVEYANIRCCCIDVQVPGEGSKRESQLLNQLMEEFNTDTPQPLLAYRHNYRLVHTYEPVPLAPGFSKTPTNHQSLLHLKPGGVYMITGGLGGIGLTTALYLAQRIKAKLILISRTPLPLRSAWEQWLNTHYFRHPTSRKIRKCCR